MYLFIIIILFSGEKMLTYNVQVQLENHDTAHIEVKGFDALMFGSTGEFLFGTQSKCECRKQICFWKRNQVTCPKP